MLWRTFQTTLRIAFLHQQYYPFTQTYKKELNELKTNCIKPLADLENSKMDNIRTNITMISCNLDSKKQSSTTSINLDKLRNEFLVIIENLASKLFEEINLKAQNNSILLVGTEENRASRSSLTTKLLNKKDVKHKVSNFLSQILKPSPLQPKPATSRVISNEDVPQAVSYRYINLENAI